jgi:hypothetical protein
MISAPERGPAFGGTAAAPAGEVRDRNALDILIDGS